MSLVAVRKEPADQSEQISQLLFGDHYSVIEQAPNRKWIKIKIHFDDYEGWIDVRQHQLINKEFFDHIRTEIEKVINEEEISVEIFEVLPGSLADDFQDLVTVIRGRVMELNERITAQELSFVYIDQQ